ncbi:hypothetical protein ACIP8U_25935 [Streptomyces pseudovenezuelae]|uniref:hypothetical protein n=1 Tax=Streptomyces pseudovenezuelae TaxID=67350 RepID=UPI0036ED5539
MATPDEYDVDGEGESEGESRDSSRRFRDMNYVGFYAYVRRTHEAYGKPKYKEIAARAKEYDPESSLSTSTISDTLRGKSFPRIETARWIGQGLGGDQLGATFERAWRAARRGQHEKVHQEAKGAAEEAQERERISREKPLRLGQLLRPPGWMEPWGPLLAILFGMATAALLIWELTQH